MPLGISFQSLKVKACGGMGGILIKRTVERTNVVQLTRQERVVFAASRSNRDAQNHPQNGQQETVRAYVSSPCQIESISELTFFGGQLDVRREVEGCNASLEASFDGQTALRRYRRAASVAAPDSSALKLDCFA